MRRQRIAAIGQSGSERGEGLAELFPEADHRLADRDDAAALSTALAGGAWDATLDVCAYRPQQVTVLADALDGRGGGYLFVSSASVYLASTADPAASPAAGLTARSVAASARDVLADGNPRTFHDGRPRGRTVGPLSRLAAELPHPALA
jgi:hypothetical protein